MTGQNSSLKGRQPLANWAYFSEKEFIKMLVQLCEDFEFDGESDPVSQIVDHFYVMVYQMNFFYKKMMDELDKEKTGRRNHTSIY